MKRETTDASKKEETKMTLQPLVDLYGRVSNRVPSEFHFDYRYDNPLFIWS